MSGAQDTGAYLTLLGRIGAHKAGYAVVMFPVVALLVSFLFEGLEPQWNILAGIILVIVGSVFILGTERRVKLSRTLPRHQSQHPVPVSCAPDIAR